MSTGECYWYIGASLRPWESAVAGALARALLKEGVPLRCFSGGGGENLGIPELLSWNSLTLLERSVLVGTRGSLWHLWGTPPFWWKFLRIRARTVHTRFDGACEWKGHPTRLAASLCSGGETYIPPTFDVKVHWIEDGSAPEKEDPAPLFLLPGGTREEWKIFGNAAEEFSGTLSDPEENGGGGKLPSAGNAFLVLPRPGLSSALLAAHGALMGIPAAGAPSALLDEILGKEGYIRLSSWKDREDVLSALRLLVGDEGRNASASARRYGTEQFPPSKGSGKLLSLYRALSEKGE